MTLGASFDLFSVLHSHFFTIYDMVCSKVLLNFYHVASVFLALSSYEGAAWDPRINTLHHWVLLINHTMGTEVPNNKLGCRPYTVTSNSIFPTGLIVVARIPSFKT